MSESSRTLLDPYPYPALFHAADDAAVSAQRKFLRLSAIRLWALVSVAAVAVPAVLLETWAAILALPPIVIAAGCEILLMTQQPDRQWHRARAVAESAKTLLWRYQVGGRPFGHGGSGSKEVDQAFLSRIQDLLARFPDLDLPPARQDQITPSMRELRSQPLGQRKVAYLECRIRDQRDWYAAKAEWNKKRGWRFQIGLVSIELLALLAAILGAANLLPFGVYSVLAALAIAGVGWLQIKRHRSIGAAYSLASHDLASASSTLSAIDDEEAWEGFVSETEEAISREHTLWLAAHSVRIFPPSDGPNRMRSALKG